MGVGPCVSPTGEHLVYSLTVTVGGEPVHRIVGRFSALRAEHAHIADILGLPTPPARFPSAHHMSMMLVPSAHVSSAATATNDAAQGPVLSPSPRGPQAKLAGRAQELRAFYARYMQHPSNLF
eukprot:COSAG01_NODE_19323_length_1017_cov_1.795207_2_plen_123_part_00